MKEYVEVWVMEDREIIQQYIKRNEVAIEMTSKKYGSRIRYTANGIVEDPLTAEECENDTYMEAWNTIPPHEPYEHFYGYLICIVRHIALNCCRFNNRLKRKAYIVNLSDELEQCIPDSWSLDAYIDDITLREIINKFLLKLNKEKRTIFIRRYLFLDTISEIACRYHLTESKVKIVLFREREKLREYLEKEGYSI